MVDLAIDLLSDTIDGDLAWNTLGDDLATATDDLVTNVLVSIFTWRTSNYDDRGGYWNDCLEDVPIGSRLRELYRSKKLPQTLGLAQAYVTESLQWLISDGLVKSFTVTTFWFNVNWLAIEITVTKLDGTLLPINITSKL